MAIEDKNDKQILDPLENDFPIKAIAVDFMDLNNLNLIIKNSFQEAFKLIDDFNGVWYFIVKLNIIMNTIDIIGLANIKFSNDKTMEIYWLEINKVMRNKGYTRQILDYFQRWAKFIHCKKIRLLVNTKDNMKLFKRFDFIKENDNSLNLIKNIES